MESQSLCVLARIIMAVVSQNGKKQSLKKESWPLISLETFYRI